MLKWSETLAGADAGQPGSCQVVLVHVILEDSRQQDSRPPVLADSRLVVYTLLVGHAVSVHRALLCQGQLTYACSFALVWV